MKNTYCVQATYEDFVKDPVAERSLFRIQADGKILFCQGADFVNTDVLNKLTYGAPIYMGVRALRNGTFWVHWLYSEEYDALMPALKEQKHDAKKTIVFMACYVGVVLALAALPFFAGNVEATVTILTLGLGSFIYGFKTFKRGLKGSAVTMDNKMKWLLAQGTDLIHGKTVHFNELATIKANFEYEDRPMLYESAQTGYKAAKTGGIPSTQVAADLAAAQEKNLFHVQGQVKSLNYHLQSNSLRDDSDLTVTYTFTVDNKLFSLERKIHIRSNHSLYYENHAFILAMRDLVYIIASKKDHCVKKLYNASNGDTFPIELKEELAEGNKVTAS